MVENERKIVLHIADPQSYRRELEHDHHGLTYDIRQSYLSGRARVRHIVAHDNVHSELYLFTYKTKVNGETIEIETGISAADFTKLWSVSKSTIYKTRVRVNTDAGCWEVDFFKAPSTDAIYLVMAEIELPEGVADPEIIPTFIKRNLLYRVPVSDNRFSNRCLSDVDRVRHLVASLRLRNFG